LPVPSKLDRRAIHKTPERQIDLEVPRYRPFTGEAKKTLERR